jgi:serine phosphatase RsbU (regulator of sigma subunit)
VSWKPEGPAAAALTDPASPGGRGAGPRDSGSRESGHRPGAFDGDRDRDRDRDRDGASPPSGRSAPPGSAWDGLLTAALTAAPGAVALLRDHDHRLDFANRAFRDGFGVYGGVGRPIGRLVPRFEPLGLLDALDHVYATGTVFTAPEVRLGVYGPGGHPATLRVTCSPARHPDNGPVVGVLLSAVDCTDQAATVDRLRAGERRHRNAAVALQRSLLPQRLSQPDDLRIAGCYLPGAGEADAADSLGLGTLGAPLGSASAAAALNSTLGSSALGSSSGPALGSTLGTTVIGPRRRVAEPGEFKVGGDWYDVIPLGGGCTALVMGDVMGRGVHAAAVMGQLRAAVRAYAAANLPPGELMLHLDRHAAELEGVAYAQGSASAGTCDVGALATAVYAVYDPDTSVLTYARAGHLAPMLRLPDASVVSLDAAGGPPLGIGEWTWQEACIAVPAGSYLALFTDGLVERRGTDIDEQLGRLREVFARAPEAPAPAAPLPAARHGAGPGPVDFVRDGLLAGIDLPIGHEDDAALLVVHVPLWQGERAALFRAAGIDLVGGSEIAAHARAFASGVLRSWHVGEDLVDAGVLAVSELVANAAVHGRPPVRLRLRRTDRRLIVDVSDSDDHLPRRRLADDTDEDGRGIGIVAALASSWGARQLESGKSVWCEFPL